jgi:hypothetical protein
VRFQVLTGASNKTAVFWVVGPCSLEEHLIALIVEAASSSETSVNFYQTTRRSNPEDSHLQQNNVSKLDLKVCVKFFSR